MERRRNCGFIILKYVYILCVCLCVCVFSFIFVSFHSCRSWVWYTWTVISVWIRRLKMTVRCPASRTAPGAARNSGSSATSHCPRYSEIAHGWTDGQTHTATLMEREHERERTAFLSILVVCLQNDLKEQNRICIWISPSLHLAEEKKKTNEGEEDLWRNKLEFDALILLVRGAVDILVMFTRTPPF